MSRRPTRAAMLTVALFSLPAAATAQAAPPRLTIAEAARRALAGHPARRGAEATLAEARHAAGKAAAARLPSLLLSASAVRYQEPMLVQPLHGLPPVASATFDETLVQGGATLSYTLFDGGARGARIRGARARVDAASSALDAADQSLLAAVVSAYAQAVGRQQVLDAQDARVGALEAEVTRVKRLQSVGRAATVDVLRAEAALAAARAERVRIGATVGLAERELARLIGGADDDTRAARLIVLRPADAALPPREDLLRAAMARSPAVQQARERVAAADAESAEARAARWPSLSLLAGYVDRGAPSHDYRGEWNAGVALAHPVFTGGARSSEIARAVASGTAARERLRLAELQLAQELDRAHSALEESRARNESLTSAAARYAEVARIARIALESGSGTQIDYLTAEADLLAARAALAETKMSEVAARAELARVGGELDLDWLSRNLEERQ